MSRCRHKDKRYRCLADTFSARTSVNRTIGSLVALKYENISFCGKPRMSKVISSDLWNHLRNTSNGKIEQQNNIKNYQQLVYSINTFPCKGRKKCKELISIFSANLKCIRAGSSTKLAFATATFMACKYLTRIFHGIGFLLSEYGLQWVDNSKRVH